MIRLFYLFFAFLFPLRLFAQQADLHSTRPMLISKPVELDWKSIKWPSLHFDRDSVDGGAAIYTMSSPESVKFEITMIFPGGVYLLPESDRTALNATADMLIRGGFGNLNFEQIQNYLTAYAIDLKTGVNASGQLVVTAEALNEDFPRVLDLLYALVLKPHFDESSLDIWKSQSKNAFISLMNGNTLEKQTKFLDMESSVLAFGKDHPLSRSIERMSPKAIDHVTNERIKEIYQKVINRNGLLVSLSGKFNQSNMQELKKLMEKIPRSSPPVFTWVPSRQFVQNKNSIRVLIIKKDDMTQSNIMMRYYFPYLGKLNAIEKTQYEILQEIFSSSGGVVGNDRFSKALRADSGISYSPHAYFNDDILYPNTDVGFFHLSFQSPNERLAEAVGLAQKTWNDFLEHGISEAELQTTRSFMINRLLAKEFTVFDKTDQLMWKIERNQLPNSDPIQEQLVKLDAQRNVAELNQDLQQISKAETIPVLVIMGNPDATQVSKLKDVLKLDQIDVMEWGSK